MLNTLKYLGKEALNMCKAFSRKALLSFKICRTVSSSKIKLRTEIVEMFCEKKY